MRFLSKFNPTVRKFPDPEPGAAQTQRPRSSRKFIGSAYRPIDRMGLWLIWGSTVAAVVLGFLKSGGKALPLLAIGAAVGPAVAILIARMGKGEWGQVVGLVYMITALFLVLAFF